MEPVKVMLAASEIPTIEQIRFPVMVSAKLDGVRCVVLGGVAYSRKLVPIPNPFVQQWASEHRESLEGLDGELIVGAPVPLGPGDDVFNRTSGALRRGSQEPDFSFWVFDSVHMPDKTAICRYEALGVDYGFNRLGPRVSIVQQFLVLNDTRLLSLAEYSASAGYEGLILKDPHGMYKHGRSTIREGTLLKWKEFGDAEAEILEVIQGSTNNNEAQKDALGRTKRSSSKAGLVPKEAVGSFRVRSTSGTFGEFCCGTGSLTDLELAGLWGNREFLVGKIFTYKYQKTGSINAPRFPQFKGWRDDWDMENTE